MSIVHTAATLSSLSQPAPLALWGVLHNQLIEVGGEKLRLVSQMVLHDVQHLLLSVTSLKETGEGISSQWVELQEKHPTVHSVRSGQIRDYILIH